MSYIKLTDNIFAVEAEPDPKDYVYLDTLKERLFELQSETAQYQDYIDQLESQKTGDVLLNKVICERQLYYANEQEHLQSSVEKLEKQINELEKL